MKTKPYQRVGVVCLLALLHAPAWAQRAPIVVDGDRWLNSSPSERKAFLVGAANMITLESAYSTRKGTPAPAAGAMAAKALDEMTLDQVSNRITRWYESNPSRHNVPVLGVVWIDMVQPGAARR